MVKGIKTFFLVFCLSVATADAYAATATIGVNDPKDIEDESLCIYTPDSVYEQNRDLVLLFDKLYCYCAQNKFDVDNLPALLQWQDEYSEEIVEYFDNEYPESQHLNVHEKEDTVFNRVLSIYEDGYTTYEMAQYGIVKYDICMYRHLSAINNFMSFNMPDTKVKLFKEELRCWLEFEEKYRDFCYDIIEVSFWMGSIRSVSCMYARDEILEAHFNLYDTDDPISLDNHRELDISREKAKKSLLNHCRESLSNISAPDAYSYIDDKENKKAYEKAIARARKSLSQVDGALSKWLRAQKAYTDEMFPDPDMDIVSRKHVVRCINNLKEIVSDNTQL